MDKKYRLLISVPEGYTYRVPMVEEDPEIGELLPYIEQAFRVHNQVKEGESIKTPLLIDFIENINSLDIETYSDDILDICYEYTSITNIEDTIDILLEMVNTASYINQAVKQCYSIVQDAIYNAWRNACDEESKDTTPTLVFQRECTKAFIHQLKQRLS